MDPSPRKKRRKDRHNEGNDAYAAAYKDFRYERLSLPSWKQAHVDEDGNIDPTNLQSYHLRDMLDQSFQSSYRVGRVMEENKEVTISNRHMIVHQHVNGLVVVTAGTMFCSKDDEPCIISQGTDNRQMAADPDNDKARDIQSFEYPTEVQSANIEHAVSTKSEDGNRTTLSAGEKRKLISKLVKGKKQVPHSIRPNDTLAVVSTTGGGKVELPSTVFGLVLELNKTLLSKNDEESNNVKMKSLLKEDPLLDGYLAIILPAGPFPPPENIIGHVAGATNHDVLGG